MSIGNIVNEYGEKYSPYMGGFVNHLPMGQLAIYKMTGDLKKVEDYSELFLSMYRIDRVKPEYHKVDTLEECVGKRELYESCLELFESRVDDCKKDEFIKDILNRYDTGMSSGLFHVLIRLAYSVEGYEMDREMIREIRRSLAYYITAYKKADVFTGNTQDSDYLELGLAAESSQEEKIKSLLKIATSNYISTGSIVALHCITGIHALTVLKSYYRDFSKAVDIMTACIASYLKADGGLEDGVSDMEISSKTWDEIICKGSKASDVHAVKLAYSSYELYKMYGLEELKYAALKRIEI
ncbi:hypothetical protein EUAN_14600 [Andreesenia angusta]|uniref:Uncharacterized protein n=1 Tax=Andreesenia angusta TaxID=39480 RepID=A0A1S1V626_9FIRM|nr:DUF4243 domain-containing protein [Andreesenia angusta]OHW62012.1 hypothetical protein EUAN_14600 [Andreesenia angusta]